MTQKSNLRLQQFELENPLTVLRNAVDLLNVHVSDAEIKKVLHHPYYPSLSSLSDFLNSWGIETFAARIQPTQLKEISFPAIAHSHKYGGQFMLLTQVKNDVVTYHDSETGWITETLEKFLTNWTGIVLLMEPRDITGDDHSSEKRRQERIRRMSKVTSVTLSAIIIASLALYSFFTGSIVSTASGLLFVAGVVVSSLIVSAEMGDSFAKSFCLTGKSMDCQSILKSRASTLFGWIKMSDIGIVWFLAFSLSWLFGLLNDTLPVVLAGLSALSFCAVAYVPFSIGYQWFVARKWCSLCLTIQFFLVVNAIILSRYFTNLGSLLSDFNAVFAIGIGFVLAVTIWLLIKPILIGSYKLLEQEKDLFAFKLDTELFRKIWEKQVPVDVGRYDKEVRVGLKDAPLELVLVTNPLCQACASAHEKLEKIYRRLPEKVSVLTRFLANPNDESMKILQHLFSLPQQSLNEALQAWFRVRDYKTWARLYPAEINEQGRRLANDHVLWSNWARIDRTPAVFLNSRRIPSQYKTEDLSYHLFNFDTERPIASEREVLA